MLGLIILGIILLILLIVIVSNVKVVPQAHAYVIERLGTYHVTWSTGLHVKIPFIDKISKKVSCNRGRKAHCRTRNRMRGKQRKYRRIKNNQ